MSPERMARIIIDQQVEALEATVELIRYGQAFGLTLDAVAASLERTAAAVKDDPKVFDDVLRAVKEGRAGKVFARRLNA